MTVINIDNGFPNAQLQTYNSQFPFFGKIDSTEDG